MDLWKSTSNFLNLKLNWNLTSAIKLCMHVGASCWPNFNSIAFANLKLQNDIVDMDVCGRPLFINPVTYLNFGISILK